MRILVAPDKFKGTLSSREVTAAITRALRKKYPEAEIVGIPLADGGEGSLEAIADHVVAKRHRIQVAGPLARPVSAEYLLAADGRAWIETSQACGLRHVPVPRRDPGRTTTIGVGELIEDAVARGATHVTLFLGGSATNDCGAGMAGALGYRFFSDRPDDFIPTGRSLKYVRWIDRLEVLPALQNVTFSAACDVTNPLLGQNGATYVYAPQKGATPDQLAELDAGMSHFAERLTLDLRVNVAERQGSGAAGGLAAGLIAFLNANLISAGEYLLDLLGFAPAFLGNFDLVVTGEGKLDEQTLSGKLIHRLASRVRAAGVPKMIAICGENELTSEQQKQLGLTAAYALLDQDGISKDDAFYRTTKSLEKLVQARI